MHKECSAWGWHCAGLQYLQLCVCGSNQLQTENTERNTSSVLNVSSTFFLSFSFKQSSTTLPKVHIAVVVISHLERVKVYGRGTGALA